MEIFICLCPRDSSQSILDFDAFARDQHLHLGSIAPIFLGAMDIRVISFDTIILVIQGWLKIALCIYGVSVCCCKRSKVKPNFDRLQRVDSAIVCIYQATIVTSSEVSKGNFPLFHRFPSKNITIWPDDFSGFLHQHVNVMAKDRRHRNAHQKVVQMIFSSNVYRSMCAVESNVIHDRHFCRTLTLCFFAVSILWGWHWFRTGCQAKIGQWASLDLIQSWWTGFSGAWKVLKGWELEWKAKFSWALEGWSCSTGPSNLIYCTIFDIRLDSIINRSFMLMQIYQASH